MPTKPKRIRRNLKTSLKIQVVCEGDTEYSYLYSILKGLSNVNILSINGGGYGKFSNHIEKYSSLYSIFLVVVDLDKAQHRDSECKLLNRLIKNLATLDIRNCIFLNGPVIEYWIACCIGRPNDTLTELSELGYVKGNTVNTFLNNQHGSIDIAKQHVNSTRVYYSKPNVDCKYGLYKEFLNERQSTLGNLLPYIEELNRS